MLISKKIVRSLPDDLDGALGSLGELAAVNSAFKEAISVAPRQCNGSTLGGILGNALNLSCNDIHAMRLRIFCHVASTVGAFEYMGKNEGGLEKCQYLPKLCTDFLKSQVGLMTLQAGDSGDTLPPLIRSSLQCTDGFATFVSGMLTALKNAMDRAEAVGNLASFFETRRAFEVLVRASTSHAELQQCVVSTNLASDQVHLKCVMEQIATPGAGTTDGAESALESARNTVIDVFGAKHAE